MFVPLKLDCANCCIIIVFLCKILSASLNKALTEISTPG